MNFDMIISFLEGYKKKEQKVEQIFQEKQQLEERIKELERLREELLAENERLKEENKAMKDEYLSLLSFMEKARKLAATEGGYSLSGKESVDQEEADEK